MALYPLLDKCENNIARLGWNGIPLHAPFCDFTNQAVRNKEIYFKFILQV